MTRLAEIRSQPLDLQEVIAAVTRADAGAVTTFAGVVRNHSMGRPVTKLEYEAYPSMAEKEMARLMPRICDEVPDVRLAAIHRIGELSVGDLAVVCAASAPHRAEAIRACHLLIDRIKESVPIWKREYGPEGEHWVGWHDARCAVHLDQLHSGQTLAGAPERGLEGTGALAAEGTNAHQSHLPEAELLGLRAAVLTVSDTRGRDNDHSGKLAQGLLVDAGVTVASTALVADEPEHIRGRLLTWIHGEPLDAVIVTGGTGIAPRDRTVEAVQPLLNRVIDGFGETFRRLSFDRVGPRALLSRAMAGTVGTVIVVVLPGSPSAVRLGVSEIVIPLLAHAVTMLKGRSDHHHSCCTEPSP